MEEMQAGWQGFHKKVTDPRLNVIASFARRAKRLHRAERGEAIFNVQEEDCLIVSKER